MYKPPPAGNASLITLGAIGTEASAVAHASSILEFSTNPVDKLPPTGNESLETLGD